MQDCGGEATGIVEWQTSAGPQAPDPGLAARLRRM
jgi:hypothetical protein